MNVRTYIRKSVLQQQICGKIHLRIYLKQSIVDALHACIVYNLFILTIFFYFTFNILYFMVVAEVVV